MELVSRLENCISMLDWPEFDQSIVCRSVLTWELIMRYVEDYCMVTIWMISKKCGVLSVVRSLERF